MHMVKNMVAHRRRYRGEVRTRWCSVHWRATFLNTLFTMQMPERDELLDRNSTMSNLTGQEEGLSVYEVRPCLDCEETTDMTVWRS